MGKLDKVQLNPAFAHHASHGHGDHMTGHAVPGNIARDGAPKRAHVVPIHGGMAKQTDSGAVAFGGDHATALDSVSGRTVPAGRSVATPGWGNGTARSGNPMLHEPGSKNVKPVAVHPNMTRGANHDQMLAELGRAVLQNGFDASAPDDRSAHGRPRFPGRSGRDYDK